jgi:hypothetical protein
MNTGRTWTKGGWHVGNRRKSHHARDNLALPADCQTLVSRREKTDRTGEMRE